MSRATGIEIGAEASPKRTFVWALEWPGWCRSGKDLELAMASLDAYAERYREVAEVAGLPLPDDSAGELRVVEAVAGGGRTEFGVPSAITASDRRPTTAHEGERIAALVEAAWIVFDRVSASASPELRKGPRGGGRDRDKLIGHVIEADHAYAREIGVRSPAPSLDDRSTVDAERTAVLQILRQPSDGTPLADRKWTQRYAARRIAWHALDHAWEMEDRTER